MKRICLLLAPVVVAAVLLAACSSEPRSVTIHKQGVYKGEKDPLLAKQKQQELIDRMKLVQSDR